METYARCRVTYVKNMDMAKWIMNRNVLGCLIFELAKTIVLERETVLCIYESRITYLRIKCKFIDYETKGSRKNK